MSTSDFGNFMRILVCFCAGVIFGFVMQKSRVSEPTIIQQQMLMERFVMMKMFLSAVASGMFCFSILDILPHTQRHFRTAARNFNASISNKSMLNGLIGGAFIGLGMTLSGSCPGTIFVQIGSSTNNAWYALAGAALGVLLYCSFEQILDDFLRNNDSRVNISLRGFDGDGYAAHALPIASILGIVVFALEFAFPWKSELPGSKTMALPPIVAGIIVGCMQIPLVIAVEDTLGITSSYCTVLAQFLSWKYSYLANYKTGLANWWQVANMCGIVGGSYLSSNYWGCPAWTSNVTALEMFIGGALMLFGARLAGGCTSGHGISGVGFLSQLSVATVAAMFTAGISSGFLSRYINLVSVISSFKRLLPISENLFL